MIVKTYKVEPLGYIAKEEDWALLYSNWTYSNPNSQSFHLSVGQIPYDTLYWDFGGSLVAQW